jgi:peroxiredoxin
MMKVTSIFILVIFGCLSAAAQTQPDNSLIFKTEAPVLLPEDAGISFAMDEQKFKELSKQISAKLPNFVPIKRKPAKLTADALFGFSIIIQGKNISWILDGNETNGYVLYADFNADGDLTDDKPLKFIKTDGKYKYEMHKTLTEMTGKRKRKYSYNLRLTVSKYVPTGKTEKEIVLRVQNGTIRRGELNFNNRKMAFALTGSNGHYDAESNSLYFDFDNDGKLNTETSYSSEAYKVRDKYVNIGDRSYEFTVDRYGERLTLKRLDEKMQDSADLRVGSRAPEFSFKDLDGNLRWLSDFRGKVVLIDVWGAWCAPCVAEAPKLAAVYQNLKDKGFEIISLNKGDTIEDLQKFIHKNQMNWTHTQADASFLTIYRVDSYPAYFLLNKEGEIVSNTMRAGEAMYKKVEEMLGK